jgi:hypothetical protein
MLILPSSTEPVTPVGFTAAAGSLAAQVDPPTESSGPLHRLLTVTVKAAIDDPDQTYTATDVVYAYRQLYDRAGAREQERLADIARCRKYLANKINQQRALALRAAQREQEERIRKALTAKAGLEELERATRVVITRGTDPTQACNIMTYETFGGEVPGPVRADRPTPSGADDQTGRAVKTSAQGRLEEWSLGTLTSFATGGFMLIGAALPSMVSLPRETGLTSGERGVCGFSDQRLLGVALLEEGPASPDIDPFTRFLELMTKSDEIAQQALHAAIKARS